MQINFGPYQGSHNLVIRPLIVIIMNQVQVLKSFNLNLDLRLQLGLDINIYNIYLLNTRKSNTFIPVQIFFRSWGLEIRLIFLYLK